MTNPSSDASGRDIVDRLWEQLDAVSQGAADTIMVLRAQLAASKEQEEYLASLLSLATISPEEHEDVKRRLAEKEKEVQKWITVSARASEEIDSIGETCDEFETKYYEIKRQLEAIRKQTDEMIEKAKEFMSPHDKMMFEAELSPATAEEESK